MKHQGKYTCIGVGSAFVIALAAGCSSGETMATSQGESASDVSAGIEMQALFAADSDVQGIRFDVMPVSCEDGSPSADGVSSTATIDSDQTIPGNIEELRNSPLAGDSQHLFADSFEVLPAGCYDVTATPLSGDGGVSEDCAAASKDGVVVYEGETTEIILINQCRGVDPGALDVVATLNHEPVLLDVNFVDSKFVCGYTTQLCALASDPDGDPVELELDSGDCEATVMAVDGANEAGSECWEVTCTSNGKHDLVVRAYDLIQGEDAGMTRVEDWLASEGYANESHAQMDLFAYLGGVQLWPDDDGDGFGDADAEPIVTCDEGDAGTVDGMLDGGAFSLLVDNSDDCDDGSEDVHPGAYEDCTDGVDNDCDGIIDVIIR